MDLGRTQISAARTRTERQPFRLDFRQRVSLGGYLALVLLGTLAQHLFEIPPSIFSNKRNVLNTVFVKLGWAWTSTPLLFLMPLLAYSEGTTASSSRWTRVAKAAVRWSLATVYWALLTQWFFGYSVFDRVLIRTGSCSLGGDYSHHKHCHAEGGRWDGFDISGHCLLLIHSSLFALEELFPLRRLLGRQMDNLGTAARAQLLLGVFLLGIVALWAVMLLATSLYFHDWQEKLLGSFLGSAFWLATYCWLYRVFDLGP